jgi:hypothetical protein
MHGDYRLIPPGWECDGCPYWSVVAPADHPGGVLTAHCPYLDVTESGCLGDSVRIREVDSSRTQYLGPASGRAWRRVRASRRGHRARNQLRLAGAGLDLDGRRRGAGQRQRVGARHRCARAPEFGGLCQVKRGARRSDRLAAASLRLNGARRPHRTRSVRGTVSCSPSPAGRYLAPAHRFSSRRRILYPAAIGCSKKCLP